jgi:hypothetical protein
MLIKLLAIKIIILEIIKINNIIWQDFTCIIT